MDVASTDSESQVINNTYSHDLEGVLLGADLVFLRVPAGVPCSGGDL